MTRAIFKGTLKFAGVELPVKLYSAVEARGVHFRLLHAHDGVPVKQRMINARTREPVPAEQISKAYPAATGSLVVLKEDELSSLEPKPSRDIVITHFVASDRINPQWYERPYFLGPDGDEAIYAALAAALTQENKQGIARWVMRKDRYVGALRAHGEHLMLIALHHADELVLIPPLAVPEQRQPDAKERRLAEQLIAALEGPFEPEQYHDEYRARVLELVEAKARGRKIKLARPIEKQTRGALAQALQRSIAAAKEKRVA